MEQSIDDQIEALRLRMISSAIEKGRIHPDTIHLSRQLDGLLNDSSAVLPERWNKGILREKPKK